MGDSGKRLEQLYFFHALSLDSYWMAPNQLLFVCVVFVIGYFICNDYLFSNYGYIVTDPSLASFSLFL